MTDEVTVTGADNSIDVSSAVDDIAQDALPNEEILSAEGGDSSETTDDSGSSSTQTPPVAAKDPTAPPSAASSDAVLQPPSSVSGAVKEQWATLAPAVQQDILKREEDFHRGIAEMKQPAELGNGMVDILSPYIPAFKQYGVNPITHVENLLYHHNQLLFGPQSEKLEILAGLASEAGVDLNQIAGRQASGTPVEVTHLQREIAQLRGELSNVNSWKAESDSKAVEAHLQQVANDSVNYPYFWDVAQDLISIYKENPRTPFAAAYRRAVAESSVAQEKIIALKVEERNKAATTRAKSAVKARGVQPASSSSVRPTSNTGGDFDLDASLKESLHEINSRT